ncbi:reductive dehalogenase [Parendozoicomonas haliclonae]|uniref:3-chloro-4-hydroxyphenylacetate reductive dehalogenase n=1 Tax=Parendozoicomonas haliclonae TaxID=1960125 RepID=A0A1X7AR10_9GAMM|nr:reductive dehalogenase [Parendozoicomonas haliclonae]SMA50761.1 3-chloro-4-hydroxyphenylacetate reductive dehalogenase precursor [Parendozoicomonas haliclonae]
MNSTDEKAPGNEARLDRRNLLKLGLAGTAAALTSALPATAQAREDGIGVVKHDEFPMKISPDYKRFSEADTSFNRFTRAGKSFHRKPKPEENRPGYTSYDWALKVASKEIHNALINLTPAYQGTLPKVFKPAAFNPDFRFKDSAMAHAVIKRAARHFGADLVGITRHDPRWDYTHVREGKKYHKTEDVMGFVPKTVIVLGYEVDYETMRTAPSPLGDASQIDGYSRMSKTALQMVSFLSKLGFHAIGPGNGYGLTIPYAIAAGLGENSRMGLLVNHKYGPRLRLGKIYTDLELDEYYDKPTTFGVESFCKNCMHCADNCPSKSIPHDKEPSMGPPDDGQDWGFSNPGIRKWYVNCDTCLQYWSDSNTSCSSCVTTCPYNKPYFWHHRLIDKVNTILPGPLHKFMADMDLLHGYGQTFNTSAPAVFWDAKGREYDGFGG